MDKFAPHNVLLWLLPLLGTAYAAAQAQSCQVTPTIEPDLLPVPFSTSSIWNRPIPQDAVYADVSAAMFGDTATSPVRVVPDLVTVGYVDPSQPLTRIERNQGWEYPLRATSTGELLYMRQLSPTACVGVSWNRTGNGAFTIIDMATGLADEGVGSWRCPGQPLLTLLPDSPRGHNIDVLHGDGLSGYGRGSGLPSLGGAIRLDELNNGPEHALAVMLPHRRYSSSQHYIWPARSADQYASDPEIGYAGPDPRYTMGTLLAVPHGVNVDAIAWETTQGAALARSAQQYGWYIVDSVGVDQTIVGLAIEVRAAVRDLGLEIDPVTNNQSVDPAVLDVTAFNNDVIAILHLLKAVVSNGPNAGEGEGEGEAMPLHWWFVIGVVAIAYFLWSAARYLFAR